MENATIYPHERIAFEHAIPLGAREDLIRFVVAAARCSPLLSKVSRNCSYEDGFDLPLTPDWERKAVDPCKVLHYHDARQLRFLVEGDQLVGLRFKDAIRYWSTEEVEELMRLIKQFVYRF
jgi:hypothetical protein